MNYKAIKFVKRPVTDITPDVFETVTLMQSNPATPTSRWVRAWWVFPVGRNIFWAARTGRSCRRTCPWRR